MKEIWKDIINYEGLYQISNFGNIRSSYTNKLLKPSEDKFGYVRFSAIKDKKQKTLRIHRLVALYFIPNKNNYSQINHIDGNKSNNHYTNLEWCTDSENKKHAYKIGLMTPGNQYIKRPRRVKRYTKS